MQLLCWWIVEQLRFVRAVGSNNWLENPAFQPALVAFTQSRLERRLRPKLAAPQLVYRNQETGLEAAERGEQVIPTYGRFSAIGKNYAICSHDLTSFLMKIKDLQDTADLLLS